jgi:ATP-dependent RNA helicase DDX3X
MTTITSVCLLVGRFSSSSSSSSSSPSSSLFLRRRFYRRQRESTTKNENNAGAGVVCNSRRELPKQKQSQQLTKKQREKIELRKREEREFFRNEVEAARTGVGGARSHGRCLPDEESELFSRETVEDETRLFSTYDDVEVKVDLESLNVNGKNEREEENRAEENGKNAPTTSSPTAIRRLSEASLSTYDEGVVTNVEQRMRLTELTPIQKHAIPLAMNGLDLVCSAHTGSGKTLAFAIPAVELALKRKAEKRESAAATTSTSLNEDRDDTDATIKLKTTITTPCKPSVVILAPTRELARQIYLDVRKVCFDTGLRVACAHGGESCKPQLEHIAFGPEILVCTPGRLLDFCDDEYVDLHEVRMLVLDEADRMLDLGFEPQLRDLLGDRGKVPTEENGRQTLLFSATFSPKVLTLASKYTRPSPYRARISVGRVGALARGVTQKLVEVVQTTNAQKELNEHKFPLLLEAIESRKKDDEKTMVFCKQVKTAIWLKDRLSSLSSSDSDSTKKITVESLHGDLTQGARVRTLEAFKDGKISVLVATDVASRGLDIPLVEHVINFDLPTDKRDFEEYVHRLGRTARAGKKGMSTSLYVAGFEDEVGNGPIYKQLKNAFKESGEALPDWFLNHADGNADEAKRAQQLKEREQQRRVRIRRREQGGNSRPDGNRRSNRSSNRSSSSNSSSDSGSNSERERRRRYERQS